MKAIKIKAGKYQLNGSKGTYTVYADYGTGRRGGVIKGWSCNVGEDYTKIPYMYCKKQMAIDACHEYEEMELC